MSVHYQNNTLYMDGVALEAVARQFGTPSYVYSRAMIGQAVQAYLQAFALLPSLVCYAVKANSNLSLLSDLAKQGVGFDIVSGGELYRVLKAGGDPQRVVFSGVGKTTAEIEMALASNIFCFNVESASELSRLQQIAQSQGIIAPISLRVNPDVNPQTHPYIATGLRENKFGVPFEAALGLYQVAKAMPNIQIIGIACHIGSQINDMAPYLEALDRLLVLVDALEHQGIALQHLDLGGGVGIAYQAENPIHLASFAQAIQKKLAGRKQRLLLEPGRSIVGAAGILLTRVEYLKPAPFATNGGEAYKNFAIVDAGMNDLIRPALYQAYHRMLPVQQRQEDGQLWQIVGPVCETGDFLGSDRLLALQEGDLLAILDAGAYGASMSSHYNTRPKPAEILVDGSEFQLIKPRESLDDLLRGEMVTLC